MRNRINTPRADDVCGLCGWWTCRCLDSAVTRAVPADSDPDMDEALRRVRAGGSR